jgi:hypothetical protein
MTSSSAVSCCLGRRRGRRSASLPVALARPTRAHRLRNGRGGPPSRQCSRSGLASGLNGCGSAVEIAPKQSESSMPVSQAGGMPQPPAGRLALLLSQSRGSFSSWLEVANLDGRERMALTRVPARGEERHVENPVWSPDGSKLAYVFYGKRGRRSLYVVNADGTGRHRLANWQQVGDIFEFSWALMAANWPSTPSACISPSATPMWRCTS